MQLTFVICIFDKSMHRLSLVGTFIHVQFVFDLRVYAMFCSGCTGVTVFLFSICRT